MSEITLAQCSQWPYIKCIGAIKPQTKGNKTMTNNQSVWNELGSIKWSADRDDIITRAIAVADGKDTARQIAKRVRDEVRAT